MVQFRKFDIDGRKKEKIVFQNQMLHYGLYVPEAGGDISLGYSLAIGTMNLSSGIF